MRIAEAWKAMADKVIAANGGIAPEWLKTQAAVKGLKSRWTMRARPCSIPTAPRQGRQQHGQWHGPGA
jgi:hypothetical protein